MALSNDLVHEFVKVTNDGTEIKQESTVYGTIVKLNNATYVRIDGSDLLTPIISTVAVSDGDRVTVMIKNHTATVTGNTSSPAAKDSDLLDLSNVVADKVSTEELEAEKARISDLEADTLTVKDKLTANEAYISDLQADNVEIKNKLTAAEGSITKLETEKLDANAADIKFATIENLEVTNETVRNIQGDFATFENATIEKLNAHDADIDDLYANKLSSESADIRYANIDFSNIGQAAMEHFYAQSGLIKDVVVGDQTITGELVGVTIRGDLIEANTIVADKLVIKGDDGLYYKLNTDGVTTESEQTDYNSLNGQIIRAKSVTAEKIAVEDLVAFGATIGGFRIGDTSIYSGVKSSVDNTTRGIYMDNQGQMAIGDANNYLKFFKTSDGSWKLIMSASTMIMSSGKTVEDAISEANDALDASMDVIVGTQTGTTGSWTGVAKFSELKDGQRIAYWLPYNGSGSATLNLTLANGTTTGPINCYYSGSTRITTHYPAGNVIHLTYKTNMSIAGSSTVYTGWWADANYNTNTDTYDRVKYSAAIKASSNISASTIIVGTTNGYFNLNTGEPFLVDIPILWTGSSITASNTGSNNYLAISFDVSGTQGMTLTAYKPVYIKGHLSGRTFTPASAAPLTQTVPTSSDGYQYMLLGNAQSSSSIYLLTEHPIFQYANGSFRSMDNIASEANKKIDFIVASGSTSSSLTLTPEAIQAITNQFVIKDSQGSATVISGGKIITDDLRSLSATIAGWEIGDGYIRDRDSQGRYVGLGSFNKTFAFFAGGTDPIGNDAKFRVGHEGHVIATDASITGNITATTLLVQQTIYSETTTIIDTTGTINYKNILSTNADGGYNSYLGIYAESDHYAGSGVVDRAKITFALNDTRAYNGAREADINLYASGYIRISADEQVVINDCTINGALTINGGTFYQGNDAADWWGGRLNNLVIESWWGISFTTNCGGQAYSGTTAVSIDCRNGSIRAGGDISTAGGLDIRGGWFDLKYNGTHYGSVFVNNGTNGALSLRSSNNAPIDIMSSYGTIQCVNEDWSVWAVVKAKQFSVQSSKRYKTNIVDMTEDRANLLLSMRPVSYDYTVMGCEKDQLGMIAEEVDAVDKFALTYDEYGRPDSLDYSKFVPQLIKLCQIQQKQIDELKTEVNELKGEATC